MNSNTTTKGTTMQSTKSEIENLTCLTHDERLAVQHIVNTKFANLDAAAQELKAWFPNWLVYRGGHHVALVRFNGGPRAMVVKAAEPTDCRDEYTVQRTASYDNRD